MANGADGAAIFEAHGHSFSVAAEGGVGIDKEAGEAAGAAIAEDGVEDAEGVLVVRDIGGHGVDDDDAGLGDAHGDFERGGVRFGGVPWG